MANLRLGLVELTNRNPWRIRLLAVLVNTAPAAFWMLLCVFSYPDVLKNIRGEIGSILTTKIDKKGVKVYSLDITNVETSCPLLTSTFQEVYAIVQRYFHSSSHARHSA